MEWEPDMKESDWFLKQLCRKAADVCLDLNNCGLTAADAKETGLSAFSSAHFNCFAAFPLDVDALDISWNDFVSGTLCLFTEQMHQVRKLKVLRLRSCGLTTEDVQTLDGAFASLDVLRMLDLPCNKELGGGYEGSPAQLAWQSTWMSWILTNSRAQMSSCPSASLPLFPNSHLIKLHSGLTVLGHTRHAGVLESLLRLRATSKIGVDLILNSEASVYLPALEMLNLSWNKCVGGNLKLLLQTLKLPRDFCFPASAIWTGHLAELQKLDLSYNNSICDTGWAIFCQNLCFLKKLTELDFSLWPLSSRGRGRWFRHLLCSVTKLPVVTEIGMRRWVIPASKKEDQKALPTTTEGAFNLTTVGFSVLLPNNE
ncbi:Lrrc31 [Phodopus roborovskii]|uniref:Lrrc31 protein n=1 Tax=Phodopus roborovskii TaxID=109678 RepID=A0AAU9ZDA0_PHORO|nr:Lrrc31 [Phodopus roborovskii]